MEGAELEAALGRVSKVLHMPLQLREPAALPKASEDTARGQHEAKLLLRTLRAELPRLKPGKTVGAEAAPAATPATGPEVALFVTDVDLFTPATDSTFAELDLAHRSGVLSVRRLREAFYRRKPDPARARSRLAKEILRAAGVLSGLPECANPDCALAPSRSVGDIDRKGEHYCAPCWKRLSAGTMRI